VDTLSAARTFLRKWLWVILAIAVTVYIFREWLWVILAIAAALAYAGMNFIDEWLIERLEGKGDVYKETDSVGILVIVSGLFGIVVAAVFGGYTLLTSTTIFVGTDLAIQAIFVGMLEISWLPAYLYATKRGGALEAAPLFQTIPVISLILGFIFFAELPPMVHVVGAFAIVVGGAILNLVPGTWKLDCRTVGLMLIASTIIAAIYFLFKDVAQEGNFVATAFWGGVGMVLAAVIVWVICPSYRREFNAFAQGIDRQSVLAQLTNEVINTFAVLASQKAVVLGPSVMVVTALNAFQPVFILLIGWILTKNGSDKHKAAFTGYEGIKKVVSIALIAVGTAIIVL
jgi:drug/metabolite transporter (DMT)-like permease